MTDEEIIASYGNRKSHGRPIELWSSCHDPCPVCGDEPPSGCHQVRPAEDEAIHVRCTLCNHVWMCERYSRLQEFRAAYERKNPLESPPQPSRPSLPWWAFWRYL